MILVTGATGFVGKEIVSQLKKSGYAVRVLVREPERWKAWASELGIDLVQGDVTEPHSLKGCCEGVTAVIHLVGIIVPRKKNTFETVHVQGTANMLAEAERAGVQRWIHMSALGTRQGARSRYHQTKWQAEERVRASSMAWTIFRPSLIYGKGDGFTSTFIRMLRLPVVGKLALPCIGDGKTNFHPVAVDEVAHCFVQALSREEAHGKTFDLAGDSISFANLLQALIKQLGMTPVWLNVPLWKLPFCMIPIWLKGGTALFTVPFSVAKVQAWLFEHLLPTPPLTRDQILMLEEGQHGDTETAPQFFGIQFRPFSFDTRSIFKNIYSN
jgi:NADH dehydrogenase